jgi:hypothetical protein
MLARRTLGESTMLEGLGRVLLRVVGCLLILAAVAAAWFASGQQDSMRGQLATIEARQAERGKTLPVERADKEIAAAEAANELMKTRMYFWYGAAAVFLIVGVVLVLLPSGGRRKAPAAEPPPP